MAGPGTGKTTALVARTRHLITHDVEPSQILCLTFSKKAAEEIKSRVERSVKNETNAPLISTFHSLAYRIITKELPEEINIKNNFTFWTKDYERLAKVKELIGEASKKKLYGKLDTDKIDPLQVLSHVDKSRDICADPEDALILDEEQGNELGEGNAYVYNKFIDFLEKENLVDYPRMVELAILALQTKSPKVEKFIDGFKHILIDEYQDINLSQKHMTDALITQETNLWVVGDDDQAIYGWRGSDVAFILNFKNNYSGTEIHKLSVNYRSGDMIIRASSRLANNLKSRFKKSFTGDRKTKGSLKFWHAPTEIHENKFLFQQITKRLETNEPKNIAVLARTHQLLSNLASILASMGIPVLLKGGVNLFSTYEARLLLSALAITSNVKKEKFWNLKLNPDLYGFSKHLHEEGKPWPQTIKALSSFILNRLPNKLTDDELLEIHSQLESCTEILLKATNAEVFFSNLVNTTKKSNDENAVFLGTIHSAKGLEWKSVFLMGFEEPLLPHWRSYSPRDLEEERRLAYVAFTRAKDEIIFTASKKRYDEPINLSRFYDEFVSSKKVKKIGQISTTSSPRAEWTPPKDPLEARFLGGSFFRPDQTLATGEKQGTSGWSDQKNAGTGLLAVAGYTVCKSGPDENQRRGILREVLTGEIDLPEWISDSVKSQWSAPHSGERLQKIRNTLNVALGNQKGRSNPSRQAIQKWEDDILFLDDILSQEIKEE